MGYQKKYWEEQWKTRVVPQTSGNADLEDLLQCDRA